MASATTPPPETTPVLPPDSEVLYEVVDGQIVEKPPMGAYPTWIAALLTVYLGTFAKTQRIGRVVPEMLFLLDPAKKLQRRPDVAFVSYGRWPRERPVPDDNAWNVIPDLAIEVVSSSNTANQVIEKVDEYFQAGVRCVWVVYPKPSLVYVYQSPTAVRVLKPGDPIDGGDVLPGFRLAIETLFSDQAD